MKNLATCKPTEFVAQTAKIRTALEKWVKAIDLIEIIEKKPVYNRIPEDADHDKVVELYQANVQMEKEMMIDKLNQLLDNMLDKHPAETLEVLALCCFVEPEKVDDHPIDEYLECIIDMVTNEKILRFFSLLAQRGQKPTSEVSNA